MQYSSFALAATFVSTVLAAQGGARILSPRAGENSLTLEADAIQSGSAQDGSNAGVSAAGQSKSLTSTNNFINNCSGKTLTNGLQITTGSCNGIPMGDIPAKTAMVSSVITFPETGKTIASNTDFTIKVQMTNLVAGSFTNALKTYYSAPQALSGGKIVGHTHVTIQDMGNSLNPTAALDPTQFAFFKGINDAGDGNGALTATVAGGLPAGNYRICTMASSSNHQAVLMPVAQRGTCDDCTKFVVTGSGTTINKASNKGVNGLAAAAEAQAAVDNFGKAPAVPAAGDSTAPIANDGGQPVASSTGVSAPAATSAAPVADSLNMQTFTGALGGLPPPVTSSNRTDRPFLTQSNTFVNSAAALQRSCAIQHNRCADAANSGKLAGGVSQCDTQETACNASISAAKKRSANIDNGFRRERKARMARRNFIV